MTNSTVCKRCSIRCNAPGPTMDEEQTYYFNEDSVRKSFIRKVYGILSSQLLVTVGIVALFTFHRPTQIYVANHVWIIILSAILALVLIVVLSCCSEFRRNYPMNLILLGIFTVVEGVLLGSVAATYRSDEVMIALIVTAATTIALTLFSFQSKVDFTKWGGALFAVLFIFIIIGLIASLFMRGRTIQLMIAAAGAVIFALYIIYDTQLMLGGKHKYSLSPEEYVFAALNLYLDIINMFLYILQLVAGSNR